MIKKKILVIKTKKLWVWLIVLTALAGVYGTAQDSTRITENTTKLGSCWTWETEGKEIKQIESDNDNIIILTNKSIISLLPNSTVNWILNLNEDNFHRTKILGDTIIHLEEANNSFGRSIFLEALSSETGIQKWRRDITQGFKSCRFENNIPPTAILDVLKTNKGDKIITVSLPDRTCEIIYTNNGLLAHRENNLIDSNNPIDLKIATQDKDRTKTTDSFSVQNTNLLIKNNEKNKIVWKLKFGAALNDVVDTGEGLIVSSNDNYVYSVKMKNGSITWKRRFENRVRILLNQTGKFILVTVLGENSIYLVQVTDGKILDKLELSEPFNYTQGLVRLNNLFIAHNPTKIFALTLNSSDCPK